MPVLPIEDMSDVFVEHSMIINNFVITVGGQVKDSLCRVFGDSMQYQWLENNNEIVIPDASIVCNTRDRRNVSLTGVPRMVMEVLSKSTEKYDRTEKMEIYRKVGVSEYWIVDWVNRTVEIYLFDDDGNGSVKPYLHKTVSDKNKEELKIIMFPNLSITFDELFKLD